MKNATEVDGALVGWGHWCGAVVPTMMEMVAAARRRRNFFFHYPHLNYLLLFECEGGGICTIMVKRGVLHKSFFHRHLRTSVFSYWPVKMAIEVCDGEKLCRHHQFSLIFGRRQFFFDFWPPPPLKPKKLWQIPVRHYKIQ